MIKNKNIFLLYLVSIVFVVSFLFGVSYAGFFARADEYVTVDSVTATYLSGFDADGQPEFVYNADYDTYFRNTANPYAKDVAVTFDVAAGAAYYKLTCLKDGEEEPEGLRLTEVPANGKVVCDDFDSGEYTVTCYVYSSTQDMLGSKSVTVKCDGDAPTLPTANAMTAWQAAGTNFDVVVDWSNAQDALSGIKAAFYKVFYNDGSMSSLHTITGSLPDRSYAVMNKAGKVVVTVYDAAGNASSRDYIYDMYDTVKPMVPSFTVSPTVVTGRYARSYTIVLTYYEDGQSGLADKQYYLMNGKSYEYENGVGIVIDEQKNYSFSFYAMDKTGNRSDYVNYEMLSSCFDVKAPYLDTATFLTEIDLTATNGVCGLSFVASDYKESGIVSVKLDGSDADFVVTENNGNYTCALRFDCFDGAYLRKVILTDAVGNRAEHSFVIDYFSDNNINAYCKELSRLYHTTDYAKCTASTKEKIDEAFSSMNILLNTTGNSFADIKAQYEAIKNLFEPVSFTKLTIASAPEYASSAVQFTVDQNDFALDTFGNTLEIVIAAAEGEDKAFVSNSGFSSGFTDYFTLDIKLNGQDLTSPLNSGLVVTTGLPSGYLDRSVKLYNVKTGEEIETIVVNNRIRFTLKESVSCALVISGSKAPTVYNDNAKTVVVFGRTWPLGSFLGVVLGVGGGAIVIAVLLMVLLKKRG